MAKILHAAGLSRLPRAALIATTAIAVASIIMARTSAMEMKDCFITDKNGRKWACSRFNNPAANLTMFDCNIENRMGTEMYLDCDGEQRAYYMRPGARWYRSYGSVFDPAPPPRYFEMARSSPQVACEWGCAGNTMAGVVVWDEQWPEAWSCRQVGGDGPCRVVFENNREVVLVTGTGRRRVLGDVAIKECSKNWWGYGRWLPFGLGCTYPKHDHPYYGTVKG